jgi:hypothetical protein
LWLVGGAGVQENGQSRYTHPLDDERRVHTWTGSLGIEHHETPSNAGFWFRSGREYGIAIIFLEKC